MTPFTKWLQEETHTHAHIHTQTLVLLDSEPKQIACREQCPVPSFKPETGPGQRGKDAGGGWG